VPVGVLVLFTAFFLLPKHIGEEHKKLKLDLPGATLATAGLISLVYGLSKAPSAGWDSATVWGFIAGGLALLVGFVLNEKRAKQPLMPLEIFKIRRFSKYATSLVPIQPSWSLPARCFRCFSS
ncbi:hypothetical protein HYU82_00960, partial [Candidatus Saccharibacteria bacterium]|nr:hypothetical protein [Candidatus Saccharibacteria bacterium]